MTTPEELIAGFNLNTARFNRSRAVTLQTVKQARSFLSWCTRQRVDPLAYVWFRLNGRSSSVKLHELANDDALIRFRKFGEGKAYEQRANDRAVAGMAFESLIGTTCLTERLKASMQSCPKLCLLTKETRGWTPESEWCRRCPVAEPCRASLPGHVQARRDAIL